MTTVLFESETGNVQSYVSAVDFRIIQVYPAQGNALISTDPNQTWAGFLQLTGEGDRVQVGTFIISYQFPVDYLVPAGQRIYCAPSAGASTILVVIEPAEISAEK